LLEGKHLFNYVFLISAFVVWARSEVGKFSNNFKKHVFAPQSTLTTIAECVSLVRSHCEQVIIAQQNTSKKKRLMACLFS